MKTAKHITVQAEGFASKVYNGFSRKDAVELFRKETGCTAECTTSNNIYGSGIGKRVYITHS